MIKVWILEPLRDGYRYAVTSTAWLDPTRIVGWASGLYEPAGQQQTWRPILDTGAIADVNVTPEGRELIEVAQKAA